MMKKDPDSRVPRHVAIIMDGNGRWAQQRRLPRSHGHKAGVEALKRTVRAAQDFGIEYLTLFSFSSENWARPEQEINELFSLLRLFVRQDLADLQKNNVRIRIIGSRVGLPADILNLLVETENLTRKNNGYTLVIAFNYGSRDEIASAMRLIAEKVTSGRVSVDEITPGMISRHLDTADIPDPDMIIRTSGEKRLSNFLAWQAIYSELIFVNCLWPEFNRSVFSSCLDEYNIRTRKFGRVIRETVS